MITNKTYDRIKWVAQYVLPALATLYFALSEIWGFPYTEEVVGTIVAFDAFLGLVMGLSSLRYKYTTEPVTQPVIKAAPRAVQIRPKGILIKMSNETYDLLITISRYILPAIGTFIFTLEGIWGFSYGKEIVGTIAALNTFMGVILGISTSQYKTEIQPMLPTKMELPNSG